MVVSTPIQTVISVSLDKYLIRSTSHYQNIGPLIIKNLFKQLWIALSSAFADACKPRTPGCANGQCAAYLGLRSFLAGPNFIIYCDQIPDPTSTYKYYSACYQAYDNAPSRWKSKVWVIFLNWDTLGLGNHVAHVPAYLEQIHTLLAKSCCSREYLISEDLGDTWMPVDYLKYLELYYYFNRTMPKLIPWATVPSTFEPSVQGTSCTEYQARQWHCKLITSCTQWNR